MSKEYDLGRVVGKDATINGQNAIQLIPGKNIDITQDGENVTVSVSDDLNAVPSERKVNGKPLSEDITLTGDDVGVVPGTTAPKMDGTATVGTGTKYSREDHIHPSDTSKQDKLHGNIYEVVGFDKDGNAVPKLMNYMDSK